MAEARNQRFSWKIFFIFLSAGSWLSHVSPFLPSATSTCLQLGESKLTDRWSYCRSMGQQTHFEHTKRGPEAKLTAEWDHYLFLPLFTFNFPPWSTHAVFGFLNSLWYQKWKRQKRKGTACQHSSRKAGSTNRMSMCACLCMWGSVPFVGWEYWSRLWVFLCVSAVCLRCGMSIFCICISGG